MKRFTLVPNLPVNASAVIYGQKYAEKLRKALDNLHVESILLPDNPNIDPRLAGHTDLSVFHAGGERLFLAPYLRGSAFASGLQNAGADFAYAEILQRPDYPLDAQLNLCAAGQHVICNPKTADADIVEYLTNAGRKKQIPVKQGYSRCAVCVVDADSVITADGGIADAAEAAGLHVLRIQPGHIRLDGFSYGLIGGAAFKLSSEKLAFTGSLDMHPDREAILSFLRERCMEPVFLTRAPLFDIGSAVPILES